MVSMFPGYSHGLARECLWIILWMDSLAQSHTHLFLMVNVELSKQQWVAVIDPLQCAKMKIVYLLEQRGSLCSRIETRMNELSGVF